MALDAGVAKLLSSAESAGVIAALEAEFGEMVFLVSDGRLVPLHLYHAPRR